MTTDVIIMLPKMCFNFEGFEEKAYEQAELAYSIK